MAVAVALAVALAAPLVFVVGAAAATVVDLVAACSLGAGRALEQPAAAMIASAESAARVSAARRREEGSESELEPAVVAESAVVAGMVRSAFGAVWRW